MLTCAGTGNADEDQHEGDGQCATNRDPSVALHGGRLFHAAALGRQWTVRHGPVHYCGDANHFGGAARAAPGQPSHVRAHGYSAADYQNADARDGNLRKHREH